MMGLFRIGNLLLKFKRKNYQDQKKKRGISVVIAVFNHRCLYRKHGIEYRFLLHLSQYLVPAFYFVAIMLNRSLIIRLLIDALEYFYQPLRRMVILVTDIYQR
jgi:hypothetical protein